MTRFSVFVTFILFSHLTGCVSGDKKTECRGLSTEVLYHGSTRSDINVLTPQRIHIRDPSEGAAVFASPSIKLASCYLFRWDDSWVRQSVLTQDNNDAQVFMIVADKERLLKQKQGGSIYILRKDSFVFDATKGLGVYEGVSKTSISPLAQIKFQSALDAMLVFGVRLYFVNQQQFDEIAKINSQNWPAYLEQHDIHAFSNANSQHA